MGFVKVRSEVVSISSTPLFSSSFELDISNLAFNC